MISFNSTILSLLFLAAFVCSAPSTVASRGQLCGSHITPKAIAAISQIQTFEFANTTALRERTSLGLPSFSPVTPRAPPSASELYVLGSIKIKFWIHIVAAGKKLEDGWIPNSQVDAQVKELKANYGPHNIQFELQGVTRTVQVDWANGGEETELPMKRALRKGDFRTLNVYIQKRPLDGLLGFSSFPIPTTEGSEDFYYDGICLRYDTVPGGTLESYNLGRTLTHEVGHWLGLFHPFEGYGCDDSYNDYIADTPRQAKANFGCPVGRDSCINDPGLDGIHNYMDYTDDACYQEFTALQTKRMFDSYLVLRGAQRCSADNCLRALRAKSIPGRLKETEELCKSIVNVIVTETKYVKPYAVSACTGNVLSRVSSACNCLASANSGSVPEN